MNAKNYRPGLAQERVSSRRETDVKFSSSKNGSSPPAKTEKPLKIGVKEVQDPDTARAKHYVGPHLINANAARHFGKGSFGSDIGQFSFAAALVEIANRVISNDLEEVERMLISQSVVLNVMFGELSRRSAENLNGGSEYHFAAESYFKMALKAQNQCRMTLETLSNIKNPPAVYAKQANIANGPQQVNNGPTTCARDANQNCADQSIGAKQ